MMTGDNLTLTAASTSDQNGDIRIQGGQLQAGKDLQLNAGRDASLKGAQVSGEQITADVKRHLTLSSEQDSNRYDMKQ
ncbi:hemagglutinin repeat-containing protein, partial [Photorhabdus sp. S14-60]|uniref:hemagglutinin repeat-containing protein n=1 Tax=Photorhabdus sp. S14-60 TaxID=2029689 RepID=UPI001EFCF7B1